MLSLAVLGSLVVVIGTARTVALVARDGYGRVPTVARY